MGMLSKVAACLLLAAVTVSCAADYSEIRSTTNLVIMSDKNIETEKGSQYSFGSGVVVAPGYVLTAKHVVHEKGAFAYTGRDGQHLKKATIFKESDSPIDLALIYAPTVACPCTKLADDNAVTDEAVSAVGFPLYDQAGTQFVTHGAVQGYSGQSEYQMTMTVNIAPGNSGGGVYSRYAKGWRLTGIATSVMVAPGDGFKSSQMVTWMSIAVSANTIREFLKGTPAEQK